MLKSEIHLPDFNLDTEKGRVAKINHARFLMLVLVL